MPRGDPSHLDLTVTDPGRSHRFYDAVLTFLGFVGGESDGENAGGWMNPRTGFSIALFVAKPEYADRPHTRHAPGLHHFAFVAESRDDVDRLYERLLELGAEILDPPGEYYAGGYYAVFFADPDGLKLEFVHLPGRRAGRANA